MDDAVGVDAFLGDGSQPVGAGHAADQQGQRQHALRLEVARVLQGVAKQANRPQRHRHVHDAEKQAGAHQAEVWRQGEGKQDGDCQRAEVVDRQHLRHQVLEGHLALQDAHDQRDLQTHQHAGCEHQRIEHQAERPGRMGEHHEQQHGGKAADDADEDLDLDEAHRQRAVDELRQP